MPNVVTIGRHSVEMCDTIARIIASLGIDPMEAVITFSPDMVCFNPATGKDSPYLVVRDTDSERAIKIAEALNEKLNIDVEIEIVQGFLPCKGEPLSQ